MAGNPVIETLCERTRPGGSSPSVNMVVAPASAASVCINFEVALFKNPNMASPYSSEMILAEPLDQVAFTSEPLVVNGKPVTSSR